nr:hypothetical protein [Tanacetum cinerariifolium]
MQQPIPNPKDITDPTTSMNMALALMAKSFKLNYSTPTNNNQRISSNPKNMQIAQPGMNMGQDRQMQMIRGNGGNQFRQYAGQNAGNLNGYNAAQNVRNQPEWSRHVTIVHQTKDLHTANYTQLYDFLKYNQKEVDELKAKILAKTQDPLALMANSINPYAFPAPHQYQSSFNQNYLQQPMPNPEDITDPTTAMNMALALMAKAFKLNYSTPTNNNQRISSNPKNKQIAQPGMNIGNPARYNDVIGNQVNQNAVQNPRVQIIGNQNGLIGVQRNGNQNQIGNGNVVAARAEGNASGHNGNQIRCYNCRRVGHYARNCIVRARRRDAAYLQTQFLIAQKEEAGIQIQAEEYDLMAAAADLDEIEEVNANCILIANLQQASTSGTQTDSAPVYDTDGSAEVHENYDDNEISNMFTQEEQYTELLEPIPESHQVPQTDNDVIHVDTSVEQGGETVEQHPVNFEETRAKPQTEAQARKNMMIYLKNVAGFKMDYFKGTSYDDIHPVFEKYFDSNVAFLQKTKEQMDEEDNRALKRLNENNYIYNNIVDFASREEISTHKGSSFGLTAFSDADHAECIDTCKSTSGGIQFLVKMEILLEPKSNKHLVGDLSYALSWKPYQGDSVNLPDHSNNPHIVPKITTTMQTLFLSQNNQVDNYVVKPIRIIPCPSGVVQTANLRKIANTRECGKKSVMSTQKYIRKVIEDVDKDDNFTHAPWLSVLDYVNVDGGIMTSCFGDVKKFLKNGKLEKVVVVIKSCTPNTLGDPTVTLKDLSGTIFGTIHYKVLTEDRFAKVITVGPVLILHNVFVFSHKQSTHNYLNITKKNMVKVFHNDGGSA